MSDDCARLRVAVSYSAETGDFVRVKSGKNAGSLNDSGHRQIQIGCVLIQAHRLAWFYMTGKWPANQIDHINGNPDDNRFSNLREATPTENARNRRVRNDSSVGKKGVSTLTGGRTGYRARIMVSGVSIFLGNFKTPELAASAYDDAAKKHFAEFSRSHI